MKIYGEANINYKQTEIKSANIFIDFNRNEIDTLIIRKIIRVAEGHDTGGSKRFQKKYNKSRKNKYKRTNKYKKGRKNKCSLYKKRTQSNQNKMF